MSRPEVEKWDAMIDISNTIADAVQVLNMEIEKANDYGLEVRVSQDMVGIGHEFPYVFAKVSLEI